MYAVVAAFNKPKKLNIMLHQPNKDRTTTPPRGNAVSLDVMLPRSLTAENGAKSLLNGEFFETVEIPNEEYCGCGECDYCHDFPEMEETITIKVMVTWATIKEIYAKIVAHYGA